MSVRLLLFASAREAAGTNAAEFEADTLADLLASAAEKYGETFAAVLARSKVWVNGEEADLGVALAPGDEIAVLPPVSGGG